MLLWLDIETTGLVAKEHRILEVGLMMTDDDLEPQYWNNWVLRYTGDKSLLHPTVQEMHTENGLWDECAKSKLTSGDVEMQARSLLVDRHRIKPGKIAMAGSSVHFDRAFIKEWMPKLESVFSYRSVDVSTVSELAKCWFPSAYGERPQPEKKPHRAIDDIKGSIELLRYWRKTVMR